jgi:hypothetical protein
MAKTTGDSVAVIRQINIKRIERINLTAIAPR